MMHRIAKDAVDAPVLPWFDGAAVAALRASATSRAALAGLEDELVDVLMRALARIVEGEFRLAPEHIRCVARSELHKLREARRIVLRIHPDDLPHVASVIEETTQDVAIETDACLTPGDCFLDSDLGSVDARIATKLARLEALIREGQLL
jgi:flagellar biosynthesis/type III secretory pathway protein FliH